MESFPHALCLGPGPDPLAVAAAWPPSEPLAALLSAREGSPLSRWSILATPASTRTLEQHDLEAGGLHGALDALLPTPASLTPEEDPDAPPFRGGHLLVLPYELGRAFEPRASHPNAGPADPEAPLAITLACPGALVHDRARQLWWCVGNEDPSRLDAFQGVEEPQGERMHAEALRPDLDDDEYAALVARTIEYVHAGDIFQANIARRFSARVDLDEVSRRRRFATTLLRESGAWFGAILETAPAPIDSTIISLSPELFLQLDPCTRTIRTRPIKGTLPAGADPRHLEESEKDAAELAMIVDLMRNDLGRVCVPGSVQVDVPRSIELHPGVIHGVAEISGRLREDVRLGALLQSSFPPGSVSGAPKVRAMQIIEELEPVRRGVYCGALGFASNCGRLELDVSIRTLMLERSSNPGDAPFSHTIHYGAGCGIVAESTPEGEAAESRAKAALLERFLATHNNPEAIETADRQEPASDRPGTLVR